MLVHHFLAEFEVAEHHLEYLVLPHPLLPLLLTLFPESLVVVLEVIFHEGKACPPHFPLLGPQECFSESGPQLADVANQLVPIHLLEQ